MEKREKLSMAGAVLAAALLLAGCSKEPADPASGPVKIEVAASVPGGVRAPRPGGDASTKATVSGEEQMHLYFAARTADESGTFVQRGEPFLGLRAAGDGARMLSFTPEQYYPEDGGGLRIQGWYPLADAIEDDKVVWNLDGYQDIITALMHEGSASSPLTTIGFEHRLTQLQIYVFGETGAAARWGKITGAEVHSLSSRYEFDLRTNMSNFTGDPVRLSSLGFTPTAIPEGDQSVAVRLGEPVMVPPVTAKQYVISFYTEKGGEVLVTLPQRNYKAGAVSKVVVWFTAATVAVKPVIEIEDWMDYGNALTYDYPRLMDDCVVVTAGLTGQMENVEFHEPWTETPTHFEWTATGNESGQNTVARKFRVAKSRFQIGTKSDFTYAEALGVEHNQTNVNKIKGCAQYSEDGVTGTWRLPTIAEGIAMARSGALRKIEHKDTYEFWTATGYGAASNLNNSDGLAYSVWVFSAPQEPTDGYWDYRHRSDVGRKNHILCIMDIE